MTASEQLAEWTASILDGGSPGAFAVEAELLPAERNFQNAMLKAQPNDSEAAFIDGRRRFTKYKALYARLGFADGRARLGNEALLTEFQAVVRKKNRRRELPADEGRKWISIECPGSPHIAAIDENAGWAVYQMTLKIVYEED
jgi:hypothetical protein